MNANSHPSSTPRAPRRLHPATFYVIAGLMLGGILVTWNYAASINDPSQNQRPPILGSVSQELKLTDHNGRPFAMSDMTGKVYVVSQVFTRCPGQCGGVAAEMKSIFEKFADRPDFRMLTFTIDPAHDQPEDLAKFRKDFGIESDHWLFLTGADEGKIRKYLRKHFKFTVAEKPLERRTKGFEETDLFDHSANVVLVDRTAKVRSNYLLLNPDYHTQSMLALEKDIAFVLNENDDSAPRRLLVMSGFGVLGLIVAITIIVGIRQRLTEQR